ncbi:MAG: DUF2851 family protein [Opitutaceae bacterium]
MVNDGSAVAEVQGLYGPFSFTEKLLQKIWLHGDFDHRAARLADGRTLRIIHPGKWNLLGGPDFKDARLAIGDGVEITGDVELHLRAGDWLAHGHASDPAYDRVVLHVVLFPAEQGYLTLGSAGLEIPLLVLLALLPHDLEEFAADESVEALTGKSLANAPGELAALAQPLLLALLRAHAEQRWRRKVHFARVRLERLGWETACHYGALEILGYRFNRSPMLRIAERWRLQDWSSILPAEVDEVFAAEAGSWSGQGARPANHPRTRLHQYARWVLASPDWPERFAQLAALMPAIPRDIATREVRRRYRFTALRDNMGRSICGGALGGTRLDNLVCDALFPLHAARSGASFDFGIWFNWFPGDQPPTLMRALRQLSVCDGRGQPTCHGFAQGLLDWCIARDARR